MRPDCLISGKLQPIGRLRVGFGAVSDPGLDFDMYRSALKPIQIWAGLPLGLDFLPLLEIRLITLPHNNAASFPLPFSFECFPFPFYPLLHDGRLNDLIRHDRTGYAIPSL